ncbi:hypothetical protein AC249_AIPGENE2547 [Exaiptasia diaphana]|nr:hypothetical protein AC249_AIPGENE2547 [Exaiptasia diaphana]
MNGETVAKKMRRAQGQDGQRLFKVSEFLSAQQINSYFSRRAAKDRQGTPVDENDIDAYQEENNFATSRLTALQTVELEHPITYDHYNICTMVVAPYAAKHVQTPRIGRSKDRCAKERAVQESTNRSQN